MTRTKFKFIEHFTELYKNIYKYNTHSHLHEECPRRKHQTLTEYKECEPLSVVKLLLPEYLIKLIRTLINYD